MKKMLFINIIILLGMLSCSDGLNNAYESTSGLDMVYVPAGTYQRNSAAVNTTYVSAFYISPHEITRTQFFSVMGYDPSDTSVSLSMDCPVQKVTWYHTLAFCNRLSIREGLTPVYTISGSTNPDSWGSVPLTNNTTWNAATCNMNADGYRLPTEMEWRWAAMGAIYDQRSGDIVGGINTGGYSKWYSGSTEPALIYANIGNYAWYNSAGSTHPVGTKLPNELGIYDLSGNVWEWCWDWWIELEPLGPTGAISNYTGPAGPDSNIHKIYLGGCYDDGSDQSSPEYRVNVHQGPTLNVGQVGFRIVRSAAATY